MQKSLKIGDEGEQLVSEWLDSHYIENQPVDSLNRPYYDLECRHKNNVFTCEIKNDVMASKTGNVAIEFWNSKQDKASGINITLSDLWFHIIGGSIFFIETWQLRKFIRENKAFKTLHGVGDNNACLYLYKKEKLLSHFYTQDISSEELYEIIKENCE